MNKQRQCKTCPWRVDADPDREIVGYSRTLHCGLAKTIADGPKIPNGDAMHIFACHKSKTGAEIPCAGWVYNQLGPGNNIGVRLAVLTGRMRPPQVIGDQHETFDRTIPKGKP